MSTKPHILVTAGPTREKIDEVRDWGNIFTGKTGLDLALAFLEMGNVTLLTSNVLHAEAYDGYSGKGGMMGVETFRSHGDLLGLLEERMTMVAGAGGVDVVAMTAAVADYRPAGTYRIVEKRVEGGKQVWVVEDVGGGGVGKVKSTFDEIAVVGRRTLKLVDQFRGAWRFKGVLIKFKLEVGLNDEELIRVAEDSRKVSGADLMVANTLAMARGDGGSRLGAYLLEEKGANWVGRGELAGRVVGWVRGKMSAGIRAL